MRDVICPCCGRVVPEAEIQRQAPSPAAIAASLEVLAAAGRAGVLGRHVHHFIGVTRLELAAGVVG